MKLTLLAAALLLATPALASTESDSGTWTAEASTDEPSMVVVALHPNGDGRSTWAHDLPRSELKGFTTADGAAKFSLAREAGTLQFDGSFQGGSGAGHYTFAPSPTYDSEMAALGFSGSSSERKSFLAFLDIGPRLVKQYRAVGFDKLTWDDLHSFTIHGVTPAQVTELRALGLALRDPQSLIDFRIHGVSPEFVRDLRKAGLAAQSEEKLVELRIHGVTPEYVQQMTALGLKLTDEQAIELRIHGVSPDYVKQLREAGYTKAGPDDVVRLRNSGFDDRDLKRE